MGNMKESNQATMAKNRHKRPEKYFFRFL